MTDHPCRGMTEAQVAAFEQLAISRSPFCVKATLDALLARGVVVRGEDIRRHDVLGEYFVPSYSVPLPVHIQWVCVVLRTGRGRRWVTYGTHRTGPMPDIEEAKRYLETGGLGEVIGLTSIALENGAPKVQMDSDMAMALCLLADEALKRRKAH